MLQIWREASIPFKADEKFSQKGMRFYKKDSKAKKEEEMRWTAKPCAWKSEIQPIKALLSLDYSYKTASWCLQKDKFNTCPADKKSIKGEKWEIYCHIKW